MCYQSDTNKMANTRPVKIMVPRAQHELLQEWVAEGKYASVAAFCNEAISAYINSQKEMELRYNEERRATAGYKSTGTERT